MVYFMVGIVRLIMLVRSMFMGNVNVFLDYELR